MRRTLLTVAILTIVGVAEPGTQAFFSHSIRPVDTAADAGIQAARLGPPFVVSPPPTASADAECLALNIYHEARGEPPEGRIAVAHVVLNRAADDRFPDDICNVVKDGGEARRHRCQFSWWCDGRSDKPTDRTAWQTSWQTAAAVLTEDAPDPTSGALWYHAEYVNPVWAGVKTPTTTIGRHIFYLD